LTYDAVSPTNTQFKNIRAVKGLIVVKHELITHH